MKRRQSRLGSARPSRSAPKRQYSELQATKAATRQWPHSSTVRSNVNLHGSQSNSTTVSPFPEISVDSVKADPSGANRRTGETPQRHPAPLRESSRRPNPDRAAARRCKSLSFFTFLAGHRSSLRALRSGLSRHILAASAVFHDPALLHSRALSISLARRQKKLLVERNRTS